MTDGDPTAEFAMVGKLGIVSDASTRAWVSPATEIGLWVTRLERARPADRHRAVVGATARLDACSIPAAEGLKLEAVATDQRYRMSMPLPHGGGN